MINHDTRNKIQDIISGTLIHWQKDHCTATRNYLCAGVSPGTTVKKDFEGKLHIKKKQAAASETYMTENHLWVTKPSQAQHVLVTAVSPHPTFPGRLQANGSAYSSKKNSK